MIILLIPVLCQAKTPTRRLRPEIKPYLHEDYFDSESFNRQISEIIKHEKEADQAKPDWSTYSSIRCGLEADRHANRKDKCKYTNAFEKLDCYNQLTNSTVSNCYNDLLDWRNELSEFEQCESDCQARWINTQILPLSPSFLIVETIDQRLTTQC